MDTKGLDDLFLETLKDVYYAEQEILGSLQELEAAAESERLREAFRHHHGETEGQIVRLEQVFGLLGVEPETKKCDGIEGILKEGRGALREFGGTPAGDAALIASAQAVEHYEITRYGTLRRWAGLLGLDKAAELLGETLEEEALTDDLLTDIADAMANVKATLTE